MRIIYTGLVYFCLPFVLLHLLWRSRKQPRYRERILERMGVVDANGFENGIWVHAASLGEVITILPLLKKLLQRYPDVKITVTTMTPTGAERVEKEFGERVHHLYVPYDMPDVIARFIATMKPQMLILIETELWPNLLNGCAKKKIPILLANARMSQRSADGYIKLKSLSNEMMQNITVFCAQTPADAERFIQLGADEASVTITKSIKFDISLPDDVEEKSQTLRVLWQDDRPVWIAASTHDGEDDIILDAHKMILEQAPNAILILVPRHPERFDKVADICHSKNLHVVRRTQQEFISDKMQVFLGDTMGEMLTYYGAADVTFVGGSLIERGGHNILEPAALAKPILSGPHVFNFELITALLKAVDGLVTVNNAEELSAEVCKLLGSDETRQQMGSNALAVVIDNRGSVDAHLNIIQKYL